MNGRNGVSGFKSPKNDIKPKCHFGLFLGILGTKTHFNPLISIYLHIFTYILCKYTDISWLNGFFRCKSQKPLFGLNSYFRPIFAIFGD